MKLDYSLETPEERKELVEKIIAETPDLNSSYLEILADYLLIAAEKKERKEKKILTENRLATINKRETSFEGLADSLESGEDGIYNLINENKNQIFQPKLEITKKDLEEIEPLRQLRSAIEDWERLLKRTEGKTAYTIKKALIEMRKDQYIIKDGYRKPVGIKPTIQSPHEPELLDTTTIDKDGNITPGGVTLLDPKVVSFILNNYVKLKNESETKFNGDLYYLMLSFDEIAEKALRPYPYLEALVTYKVDGLQLSQIADQLTLDFGLRYTPEHLSNLWRNKIPKIIADSALEEWLNWYYTEVEPGKYKKCNRCGQIKLAHNRYFSKNKTSKDGFYSLCKECRNKNRKGDDLNAT